MVYILHPNGLFFFCFDLILLDLKSVSLTLDVIIIKIKETDVNLFFCYTKNT